MKCPSCLNECTVQDRKQCRYCGTKLERESAAGTVSPAESATELPLHQHLWKYESLGTQALFVREDTRCTCGSQTSLHYSGCPRHTNNSLSPALLALYLAAKDLCRYCEEKDYREEMDARADVATAGNVSALEAILRHLQLEPVRESTPATVSPDDPDTDEDDTPSASEERERWR